MKRLLVCIDGSQYAQSCCRYAAWISSKVDVEIEVVYVTDLRQFEVPFVADLSGSLGLQPFQAVMGQLQELEKEKSEVILAQAAAQLEESGYSDTVKKTHKTGFLVDSLKELEEDRHDHYRQKRGKCEFCYRTSRFYYGACREGRYETLFCRLTGIQRSIPCIDFL